MTEESAKVDGVEISLQWHTSYLQGAAAAHCLALLTLALLGLKQVFCVCPQGLKKEDAEAALRHCNGHGDAAMLHALECLDKGGAAACAYRSMASATDSPEAFAQAAAQQARQEADLQEAQQVLARFTANNSPMQYAVKKTLSMPGTTMSHAHAWCHLEQCVSDCCHMLLYKSETPCLCMMCRHYDILQCRPMLH